jgi:hypothetical protein
VLELDYARFAQLGSTWTMSCTPKQLKKIVFGAAKQLTTPTTGVARALLPLTKLMVMMRTKALVIATKAIMEVIALRGAHQVSIRTFMGMLGVVSARLESSCASQQLVWTLL